MAKSPEELISKQPTQAQKESAQYKKSVEREVAIGKKRARRGTHREKMAAHGVEAFQKREKAYRKAGGTGMFMNPKASSEEKPKSPRSYRQVRSM